MGLPVLILGESGTGKSASMRNFSEKDVAVINVAGKPLPFKNKINCETTDDYRKVRNHLKAITEQGCKSIVIDDAQYLMSNEFMRRAMEKGYDKFTEIAQNFWTLVNSIKELPNDVIVYFLAHIERDQNGNEKIKTIGKLLDEKITVEGMFTIVLKTNVMDGVYSFLTQNSGHDTVKSPIGMFPTFAIDNDLKYVDEKIRNYYELGEYLSDDQIAKADEAAAVITGKKERRRRTAETPEANVSAPIVAPTVAPTVAETPEQPTETEAAISAAVMAPRRRRRAEAAVDIPTPDQTVYKTPEAPVAPVGTTPAPVTTTPAPEPRRKRRAAAQAKATVAPTTTTEEPELPVEILGDDSDDGDNNDDNFGLPFDV